jgi:hypothetical protein
MDRENMECGGSGGVGGCLNQGVSQMINKSLSERKRSSRSGLRLVLNLDDDRGANPQRLALALERRHALARALPQFAAIAWGRQRGQALRFAARRRCCAHFGC